MEALAQRISRYFVASGVTRPEDEEAVAFGLFHILSGAEQIALLLIPSCILGWVPEIAAYTVCFTMLKRYIGGAHAGKHWLCLTVFTGMAFGLCALCRWIPMSWRIPGIWLCCGICLVLVILRAPVPHPNNPKTPAKLKKLRRIALGLTLLQCVALTTASLVASDRAALWLLCGAVGGASAAITLILPMPREKERGDRDEKADP